MTKNILITIFCALLLSASGVWAADFAVGAPSGSDTANINAALTNALANSGPNRVIFQSGGTYVLSSTVSIAGDVKNVTFTTDGAGKATIVAPNYMAAPGAWDGMFTIISASNTSVGWDNLILLPAPFATTGQTPFVANSATMGIGVHPACATDTINMVNMVIAANNNANQPISMDGTVDPLTLTNYTMFADANVNVPAPTNPGGAGHTIYLSNFVSTGVQNQPFWTGGTVDSVPGYTRGTCGDLFVAQNCVFSYSQVSAGLIADGFTVARLYNCRAFNNGTDGLYLEHVIHGSIRSCTATFNGRTAAGAGIQTNGVAHATVENCFSEGHVAVDGSGGFDIGQTSALLTQDNSSFVMRNCIANNNQYGVLTRAIHHSLVEDCTFTNSDRCAFIERNSATAVGDCTDVFRRCTLTGNLRFTSLGTTTTTDFLAALTLYAEYQVLEDVFIDGAGSSNITRGNTIFRHPIYFYGKNLVSINSNQAGIWITDNPSIITAGHLPYAKVLGATLENCYVANCGLRTGLPFDGGQAPATTVVAQRAWAPILMFRGQRFWCINTVVENAISDAIYICYEQAGTAGIGAEAYIRDCTFINCNNKLVKLESLSDNNTKVDIDGIYSVGNPASQRSGGMATAIELQSANVTVKNVNVSNQTGSVIVNSYIGAATGTHAYSNLNLSNIGPNAISVGQTWRGRTRITNSVIRDVTNGSGVSLGSGVENMLQSVEVTNAARYGVTIGDDGLTPQSPMSVASMDDLCLYNNGLAGVRIIQGTNTEPPMTLTNSTILGSPVGVLYDYLFAQVLHVTDTIIAGDNPGGTGISIPGTVVSAFLGSPAPRIKVWTSGLVQDGTWGLTTPIQVDASNPGGTVTTTGVISGTPGFKNETPGNPDFLIVTAVSYAGKATGVGPGQTTDLDGCATYELNPLGISFWRRF